MANSTPFVADKHNIASGRLSGCDVTLRNRHVCVEIVTAN